MQLRAGRATIRRAMEYLVAIAVAVSLSYFILLLRW
jgi:hypothetical protein